MMVGCTLRVVLCQRCAHGLAQHDEDGCHVFHCLCEYNGRVVASANVEAAKRIGRGAGVAAPDAARAS